MADILSGGRCKARDVVAARHRLLVGAMQDWIMRRDPNSGEVILEQKELLARDTSDTLWEPLSRSVLARLLGYRDHSAVTRALHQIREREREAGSA